MAWNDEHFTRSRHELLRTTVTRGAYLRLRRRIVGTAGAVLALLAVAIPAALSLAADHTPKTRVASVGGGAPATTTTPTSTTLDVTTTAPPTSVLVTSAPTTVARTTTTVPDTTTSATSTTSTTLPGCDISKFSMGAATTDKPSYAAGEPVKVSAVLTNGNAAPCDYVVSYLGVVAKDATGKQVPSAGVNLDYACPNPSHSRTPARSRSTRAPIPSR